MFTLYLMSKRSYSPVMQAGDLHVLEQLRANQVNFSAQEQPKHIYIHTELSISTGARQQTDYSYKSSRLLCQINL